MASYFFLKIFNNDAQISDIEELLKENKFDFVSVNEMKEVVEKVESSFNSKNSNDNFPQNSENHQSQKMKIFKIDYLTDSFSIECIETIEKLQLKG